MSNRDFYQETFSQVHGSAEIRWEEYQAMRHGKSVKRLAMLAAVVALAAALSGLAVAANFFGLRDVLLPEKGSVYVTDENGVVVPGEYEYKDFISLSGYNDAPESQALAEWQTFLESYDQDGAIINEIGNSPTGFEEKYGSYLVYTQEMADKLEEIVSKYQLKLHRSMEVVLPTVWPLAAGGNFLRENNTAWSGYIYENGTFRYDGEADFDGYGIIEYQFSRAVRGSFDDVALNIGDLTDFQEWGYQTADGTAVTLGLGARNRSLIIADLEDSFILVNVLTGRGGDDIFSSGAIDREDLEALADSFNYTVLTPVKTPDLDAVREAGDRYMEELNSQPAGPEEEAIPSEEDLLYVQTGISMEIGREFLVLLAERLEDDRREEIADLLAYPARVETQDEIFTVNTPEEFLEHYADTIGQNRLSLAADLRWDPEPFGDGSGLAGAAQGAVWFGQVEESVIRIFTLQTDQWSIWPAVGGIGQD